MYTDGKKKIFVQNLYEISSTAKERLGTLRELDDGRCFIYSQAGAAALIAGNLLEGPAQVADHTNIAVAVAAAVDDLKVSVTLGGTTVAAANLYAEGYLHVNDAAGEGHIYKIQSHPAIGAGGTGVITLYDPIRVALTTLSEVTLTQAMGKNLVLTTATNPAGIVSGVAPIPVTAAYYFWAQVRGACPVLTAGTVVIGDDVVPSGTAGAVMPSAASNATLHSRVGRVLAVNATTEQSLIFLTIL